MPRRRNIIFEQPNETIARAESAALAGVKPTTKLNEKQFDTLKKLDQLAKESERIILTIKSVFPFNFFPDVIIIDETKVSIHTSYFFYTKQVTSVEYKDIYNVIVQQGLFFAKLEIADRFFQQKPITVEFLKNYEARLARRIIQGLIIAKNENVDFHSVPITEIRDKLERIGQSI